MKTTRQLWLCAALLVACGDDDDGVQGGNLDGGNPQLDAGHDAGRAPDSGLDSGSSRDFCADGSKVCAAGVDTQVNLCFHRTTEVASGGLVVRCFVSPEGSLSLSFTGDDLALTTPGWTYDGYEVLVQSTLSSADTTRCAQAKTEAASRDIRSDAGALSVCAQVSSFYPH